METIIVVFPKSEDAGRMRGLLMRGGYRVYAACTSGAAALQAADQLDEGVIVCGVRLKDMMYDRLFELLPGTFSMLVLSSRRMIEEGIVEEGGQGTLRSLALPAPFEEIRDELEQIREHQTFLRRARKRRSGVHTDEEKQLIGKAKEALMMRRSISEEEAHRYLQKTSMDSGTNIVETAQMILSLIG